MVENNKALANVQAEMVERVANMLHRGVPRETIATIFKQTPADIAELEQNPDIMLARAELAEEAASNASGINATWDDVEAESIAAMLVHLQGVSDPDYALKAATVSNKAIRRNANGKATDKNTITPADGMGMPAIINLNQVFVTAMQENKALQLEAKMGGIEREFKVTNALNPKDVQEMLTEVMPVKEADFAALVNVQSVEKIAEVAVKLAKVLED